MENKKEARWRKRIKERKTEEEDLKKRQEKKKENQGRSRMKRIINDGKEGEIKKEKN